MGLKKNNKKVFLKTIFENNIMIHGLKSKSENILFNSFKLLQKTSLKNYKLINILFLINIIRPTLCLFFLPLYNYKRKKVNYFGIFKKKKSFFKLKKKKKKKKKKNNKLYSLCICYVKNKK